jgi:hypothetical protein
MVYDKAISSAGFDCYENAINPFEFTDAASFYRLARTLFLKPGFYGSV